MGGIDWVMHDLFSWMEKSNTRGHNFKVRGVEVKRDVQSNFFYTVGGEWL